MREVDRGARGQGDMADREADGTGASGEEDVAIVDNTHERVNEADINERAMGAERNERATSAETNESMKANEGAATDAATDEREEMKDPAERQGQPMKDPTVRVGATMKDSNPLKAKTAGKRLQPTGREPYGLRSGLKGALLDEVQPPRTRRHTVVESVVEVETHPPPRQHRFDLGNIRLDTNVNLANPMTFREAQGDEPQDNRDDPGVETGLPDNFELQDEVFVPGGNENESNIEQAADEAFRRTLEHAARREAERAAAAAAQAADEIVVAPGDENEVNALYDDVGNDAEDDHLRERAGHVEEDLLPDEEDEARSSTDSRRGVREAQAALFAEVIANIRQAKGAFVDSFIIEKYTDNPRALLKDANLFTTLLCKLTVALGLGKENYFSEHVDALALIEIKEIYTKGPKNLRPAIRVLQRSNEVDDEYRYEMTAALKCAEAAAIATKRVLNEACLALRVPAYADDESDMSYVTDGSRASTCLRERERVVGKIIDNTSAEAEIIRALSRGETASDLPADEELVQIRKERNRFFRQYRNALTNRWRQNDAEKLARATGRPTPPPLTPAGRLANAYRRDVVDVPDLNEERISPGASTLPDDPGVERNQPPGRRVQVNEDTPELYRYTPEQIAQQRMRAARAQHAPPPPTPSGLPRGPTNTPLSSTRMRSQETSLNASGLIGDPEGSRRTRIRHTDMPVGSDIASIHSEPPRNMRRDLPRMRSQRLFDQPPPQHNATRADAERSLNDATTIRDVADALRLTAQMTLQNQRMDGYGVEYAEQAVPDKDAWYRNLPKPWNVLPNTMEKYSDEMHKIRFLLNKADTEGSQLRRFDGNEAAYFDWRPVVIHGIHRKNVSIADKFYALLMAFKRRQDAFIDSLTRDQDPSPEAYEHIIVQLERQYGGERRAYTHAASTLKYRSKLDADSQESVSDVYAEVRRYIGFCNRNDMGLYLRQGPTASELIRCFMSQRQISTMLRFCHSTGITEEAGSLYQIEAYLSSLLNLFAKEHEITGIQRLPSSRKNTRGATATTSTPQRYPYQYGVGRGGTTTFSRPYTRGNRGYGSYRGRGRGTYNNNTYRAFAVGDEGEDETYDELNRSYHDVVDEGGETEDSDSNVTEEEDEYYNYYEYPSDDELNEAHIAAAMRYVTEEYFANEGDYRAYAQAVKHEVKDCTLCEKKLNKKERHLLFMCPSFKRMNLKEKCELLQKEERCFNCLAQGHGSRSCQSTRTCSSCQKRHHSLICIKNALPGEDVSFLKDRINRTAMKKPFTGNTMGTPGSTPPPSARGAGRARGRGRGVPFSRRGQP